jgi:hypothetical protein
MPEPLIRFDFDAAVNLANNLNPVLDPTGRFYAPCHPDWPTWTRYEDGVLIITCSQDDTELARVEVAQ